MSEFNYQTGQTDTRPWGSWKVEKADLSFILKTIKVNPKEVSFKNIIIDQNIGSWLRAVVRSQTAGISCPFNVEVMFISQKKPNTA